MKLLYTLSFLTAGMTMVSSCADSAEHIPIESMAITQRSNFITIGTSGVTGTYYPTGGAICRMVKLSHSPFRCTVEATGGSVYNVNSIKTGEFDFSISQSDTAYNAYFGEGNFENAPIKELRSIMAIYPELLALVVREDAHISSLTDIKGKSINVDVKGSGSRMTTELVLAANGMSLDDLGSISEIKLSEAPNMLKNKKIDGYFGMFGHPTANIEEATESAEIELVPIYGEGVDKLVAQHPYYSEGIIAALDYDGLQEDVPSFGVKAVLVTRYDVNHEAVTAITEAVLAHFDEFKELHPAYQHITKASLLEGLAIPQHPAASLAFEEAGLDVARL